jgi:hypothetical protein
MVSPQSAGGLATAKILRTKALSDYYANPNYCKNCGAIIQVRENTKVQAARRKRFCNQSCAAVFNNNQFPRTRTSRKLSPQSTRNSSGNCQRCRAIIQFSQRRDGRFNVRRFCIVCCHISHFPASKLVETRTKGDLFDKRSNWQSARSSLREHARKVFLSSGKPLACAVCGYAIHVQIAHIKPVSSFPNETLISEINALPNLIALCPNHHWEFDHHLLNLIPEEGLEPTSHPL